ncbi:hypothetical protein SOASR014_03130 [Pectobacterium carotovorum subsp. carotovorum]|nr:hypothetical protein SOASR014_03130 [Pectobacterium carotovorum subsp. carotovorum]
MESALEALARMGAVCSLARQMLRFIREAQITVLIQLRFEGGGTMEQCPQRFL